MIDAPGTDILEYRTSQRHLSPEQFGAETVPDHEGWTGPLGSYGEPGPVGTGWQGAGVRAELGAGI